jgi:ACS family glucarate transporter-like MFS transporter
MKSYLLVAALFVLSLITYIDRAAISSAKGPMGADLGLSDQSMGAVFGAFALGYALAQVPSGWLADRIGPRLALALVVSVWSVFTAFTGLVQELGTLLVVRFLFGVAEAGAFPGAARAFYNWLPSSQHGLANGVIFSGARIGAALAFPVMAWLLVQASWRAAFYLLALPGLAWAAAWLLWFRDHPDQPPARHAPAAGAASSYERLVRSSPMMLAMIQYFASNFTNFINLSWMHPYLQEHYQLSQSQAAGYAMVPLLVGATSQWVAGLLTDALYRSRYRSWSRRLPAAFGFLLAAAGLCLVGSMASPAAAVACFTVATFGAELTISPSWAFCMDLAGTRSGAISGTMNMAGNLASFVSANAFPWLSRLTGSASAYFLTAAFLNFGGMCCWLRMRPPGSGTPEAVPQPAGRAARPAS